MGVGGGGFMGQGIIQDPSNSIVQPVLKRRLIEASLYSSSISGWCVETARLLVSSFVVW